MVFEALMFGRRNFPCPLRPLGFDSDGSCVCVCVTADEGGMYVWFLVHRSEGQAVTEEQKYHTVTTHFLRAYRRNSAQL